MKAPLLCSLAYEDIEPISKYPVVEHLQDFDHLSSRVVPEMKDIESDDNIHNGRAEVLFHIGNRLCFYLTFIYVRSIIQNDQALKSCSL